MKIFNYGSINIDHIYQVDHLVKPGETIASTDYKKVLGGKGANQSIALAKAGADVFHIGRCHQSDAWATAELQNAGVNCDLIELVDAPSGHAIIQVDKQAENSIVLFGGANKSYQQDQLLSLLASAKEGDWLLLQNECSCTNEIIEIAFQKGMHIVVNPSPMIQDIDEFPIDKVSMLVVNEIEIAQLLGREFQSEGEIVEAVNAHYPSKDVVVTLGSKGAMWIKESGCTKVDAFKVEVVDTTAAGDTFLGFLLAAIMRNKNYQEALIQGCKASSLAVQVLGASSSIPSAVQVASLKY